MAPYVIGRPEEDDDERYPTVPRVTASCPWCHKQRSRVVGHARGGVVRYHRCLECKRRFRSVEVPPPELKKN